MLIIRPFLALFVAALAGSAADGTAANGTARYYIAFLRPIPSRKSLSKAEGDRIQTAHMANIHKMAQDGVLVAAGPFDDTPHTISGIFVFKVDSLQSAQQIASRDPTVTEHRNTIDVHTWEGPPGIAAEYFRLHKLDPKTPENMQVHPLCVLYPGTAWEGSGTTRDSLLAAHTAYIDQLRQTGKLGAAGNIQAPDEMLGLVIFKSIPLEEAQTLLTADPAVQAGVLRPEYHSWWSSDHVLPW